MVLIQQSLELNNYLNRARALARDITDPEPMFKPSSNYSPYYSTPGYYYHHDSRPGILGILFPQRHVVDHYHHTSKPYREKDKKSNTGAAIAAVSLAVAGGMLLYNIGGELGKRSNAIEDLKKLDRERKIVMMDMQHNNASPLTTYKVQDIMEQHQDILETYKSDSESRLMIKGAMTTGVMLGFATCTKAWLEGSAVYAASPYMALAGLALTTGGGFAWALKNGFESTSEIVKRKASDLMNSIEAYKQTSLQGA
ncbi:MAG: hypothetical protein S4CHLAM6_08740 [Chlamydiae bacterium]|nr:hypothetical protein [Chlamydiota bacterium]